MAESRLRQCLTLGLSDAEAMAYLSLTDYDTACALAQGLSAAPCRWFTWLSAEATTLDPYDEGETRPG